MADRKLFWEVSKFLSERIIRHLNRPPNFFYQLIALVKKASLLFLVYYK